MTDEHAPDPDDGDEPALTATGAGQATAATATSIDAGTGIPATEAARAPVHAASRSVLATATDHAAARVLAHLHLRLGSLALARAELETLAGRDALDDAGLVDLAEARWRTGDVTGAGEAAAAVLGEGDDGPLVALVVAAEAALLRGRPSEARRYAGKAMAVANGGIDALFAGMPRGPVWPADSMTLSQPAPTLFDGPDLRRGGTGRPSGRGQPTERAASTQGTGMKPPPAVAVSAAAAGSLAEPTADGPEALVSPEPATIALWAALEGPPASASTPDADLDEGDATPTATALAPASAPGPTPDPELPAGDDALRQGRDALAAGDLAGASVHLALALRLTPALAPAVLDAIDGRTDRELAFVRGDAYRLVGREREARRAFADAMRPITSAGPPTDQPSEGDPA